MNGIRDRAIGALAGLALGDALGMPTQSMSRERIAERYGLITGLRAAGPDQPIAPGLPAGTVTDDTEQALLLAHLLIDGAGEIDAVAFACALSRWEADMVRRGSADLLGPSTKRAIQRLHDGESPDETGRDGTTNGAAMRITPVGIAVPVTDPAALVDAVVAASRVTHNTGIAIAAAAAVAAAVSAGVAGAGLADALDAAEGAAAAGARRGHWRAGGDVGARISWVRGWVRGMGRAALAGAVADVVGTSVAAQESVVAAFALVEALGTEPLDALTLAAELGGDTDTVAAICGAVLGAHHGVAGLPADLVATVCRVNSLDLAPVADGLLELRRRAGGDGGRRS
ncbi:ADP-ribosylglycohydrolase family protein [Pseudonocardia alaniniphila]|uniref:ADP-ribosylglycohydrolase family protein n=1 Tax=Pseudonocardia alaniniphila TaxID=75291 RepID=A0ABS9T8A0_9PSEU|nr:ADP-ribosylglycohydrolase family protein [Pseudonocardia alaniniphila]MCH6164653.1 ADP-ribosylglycohydrolase family protein [Pseudonocardia alaniniphila]